MKPYIGLAMMAEADFVSAILPLLQGDEIDVLEWSFDTFFNTKEPDWLSDLLDFYSENNRLIGHGVYYSLFDARWTSRQQEWLEKLKAETQRRNYNHITEHFGFMNTENFHQGVPLPVSLHSKTLEIGKDKLYRLQNVLNIPVGIENLALSFSLDDVKEQGVFLDKLTEDIDGFLILDLHNIYCQAHNFTTDIKNLVDCYPLQKVKEIHLSGGSWQEGIYEKERVIRRDTHDNAIPEEIFAVLPYVLSKCKHLQYVIIERLGYTIVTEEEKKIFLSEFERIKRIINESETKIVINSWEKPELKLSEPVENFLLHDEQKILTKMLYENIKPELIKQYEFNYFKTENWDLEMLNTA
ncbi:DUF692 family multinuclear iron-containing protein, partial [Chryseobacterium sp.]|uniref:MNIO family chryseobactin maturase n=1 Tax=Chryseobacterium sp. TaxID=1871047 RepID=UPI0025C0DDF7